MSTKGIVPKNKGTNLTGGVYGRLTVLDEAAQNKHGHRQWRCLCVCKTETVVLQTLLKKGITQSCGCLQRERSSAASVTHGHAKRRALTPEYRTWRGMLARCEIPSATHYAAYGGAGVKVCAGWHVFKVFFIDMGTKPSAGHSIDRIENSRGYDCGKCDDCNSRVATSNCRWATVAEQNRNKANSLIVVHGGRRVALVDLAKEQGVSYFALYRRIARGAALADALAALNHKTRA